MTTRVKCFCEKYPGSIIILKIINDLFHVWKKNHSITLFGCYFHIKKGFDHILLVDGDKNDDRHGKVIDKLFQNISHGEGTTPSHKK